jgi:hypothetical protein
VAPPALGFWLRRLAAVEVAERSRLDLRRNEEGVEIESRTRMRRPIPVGRDLARVDQLVQHAKLDAEVGGRLRGAQPRRLAIDRVSTANPLDTSRSTSGTPQAGARGLLMNRSGAYLRNPGLR